MISLHLPSPPSVNNLFRNVASGRAPTKTYVTWKRDATRALWGQKWKPIRGCVEVHIIIEDKGRRDLDNCGKALLDFAVYHHMIEDDNREIVRRIVMEWGVVEGAILHITPMGLTQTTAPVHINGAAATVAAE